MNTTCDAVNFSAVFKNELNNPPELGLVYEYNIKRTHRGIKNLIFVEGSDDKYFYSKSKDARFNGKHEYLYGKYSDDERGKKAVIDAYGEISLNKVFKHDLNRTYFIVDRDWDYLVEGKWETGILVTTGHSFENYYLEKRNLKKLFYLLGKPEEEIKRFWKLYSSFFEETREFWALKGTIVFAYNNKIRFNYRKVLDFNKIFTFGYRDGEILYNKQGLESEMELMEMGIYGRDRLIQYNQFLSEKLRNHPQYLRGHQALDFLKCYLKGRYDFDFDKNINPEFLKTYIFCCDYRLKNEMIK